MNKKRPDRRAPHAPEMRVISPTTSGNADVDQRYAVIDCGRHQVEAWAACSPGKGAGDA